MKITKTKKENADKTSHKSLDLLANLMGEVRLKLDELERRVASLELALLREEEMKRAKRGPSA